MSRRMLASATLVVLLATQFSVPAGREQMGAAFDPLRDSLARDGPQPIYHPNPHHPWNRLFSLLFTRTLNVRLGTPGQEGHLMAGDERLARSGPSVVRIESGDRAIDPLYPSWAWMGSRSLDMSASATGGILDQTRYSEAVELLATVAASASTQSPLARALMQADLWAAYDLLHVTRDVAGRPSGASTIRQQRRERLLRLLATAVRALALSRSQIAALPDTFAAARTGHDLPDLFDARSGWMEIRWFSTRMHEHAVNSRRAARVFLKPAESPADERTFLNGFAQGHGSHASPLQAAALIIQTLLVASDGTVVPSPIVYEVQVRRFDRDSGQTSAVMQFELSRKRLLEAPQSGGLAAFNDDAPAYLPVAGNDLSFATPPALDAQPVLVTLRQRCGACHTPALEHLMTFSMVTAPGRALPPVVRLDARAHVHAWDVAARAMTTASWTSLERYWSASR